MTVAPMMPIATYTIPAWRNPGVRRACPISRKLGTVCGMHEDFDEVTKADRADEHEHNGLDRSHAETLQRQQQKHIRRGDEDGPEQRDMKEQIHGDRAAEHFGQITRADGEFAQQPVGQRVHLGYQSRQHWARSLPVTTPSRAEMT